MSGLAAQHRLGSPIAPTDPVHASGEVPAPHDAPGASGPDARDAAAEGTSQATTGAASGGEARGGASDWQARADRLRRQLGTLEPRARNQLASGPESLAPSRTKQRAPSLSATPVETPHGSLLLKQVLLEADHHHGRAAVRGALEARAPMIADLALDPALAGVDLSGVLFFDTETTGLAGGTGTLPFVVGMGWFEEERLRLCQLVLERPGREGPILAFLAERLAKASCLVTYNGKSFDWPLVRARFVMNRQPVPQALPHLDLLHCARRIFRHRPGGARLIQFESEVLGFRRVGDVPGSEIPELYFRYLRSGDGSLLEPVLTHNAHDLVLLAALLGELSRQYDTQRAEDPRDGLGFATVAARAGDAERALAFAQASALQSTEGPLQAEALALAAEIWRRQGKHPAAADALVRALRAAGADRRPALHLMLAKLYEHQLAQPERALEHARHTRATEGAEAHAHRLARIQKKLEASGVELTERTAPLLFRG